jgi:hypothetical protein
MEKRQNAKKSVNIGVFHGKLDHKAHYSGTGLHTVRLICCLYGGHGGRILVINPTQVINCLDFLIMCRLPEKPMGAMEEKIFK